jgi:hypothetical protein
MPNSGYAASFRKKKDFTVRIQLKGSKAFPSSHSHLDKGAFVVAICNNGVAIDRGMLPYDDPRALLMKRSHMHNVITPSLPDGSYPDQDSPTRKIIPKGRGDNQGVNLKIDLANVWSSYMYKYYRKIESNDLNEFIIIDHGELIRHGRVAFHLHSTAHFELHSKSITGFINNIKFEIIAEWADKIIQKVDLMSFDKKPVSHLVLQSREIDKFALKTKFVYHLTKDIFC